MTSDRDQTQSTEVLTSTVNAGHLFDGYKFQWTPQGTYLRPIVTYYGPDLDVEKLYLAYQAWCEVNGYPNEWQRTLPPLDPEQLESDRTDFGELNLGRWHIAGYNKGEVLTEILMAMDSNAVGLSTIEDTVLIHPATDPSRGVLELIRDVELNTLAATFAAMGLPSCGTYNAETEKFETSYDVVLHDGFHILLATENTGFSTQQSCTMHTDGENASRAAQDILNRINSEIAMNTQTTTTEHAAALILGVQTSVTEAEAATISPTIVEDMATATIAPQSTLVETIGDEPTSAAATQVNVIEVGSIIHAAGIVDIVSTSANVEVPQAGADNDNVPRVGVHSVDVSRLLEAGVGGQPQRREPRPGKKPRRDAVSAEQKSARPNDQRPEGGKKPQRPVRPEASNNAQSRPAIPRVAAAAKYAEAFLERQPNAQQREAKDGVDHINVSGSAETKLGKFLDINSNTPFEHPIFGSFASIGGLWVWLSVKPEEREERIRTIAGTPARRRAQDLDRSHVQGFQLMIAEAIWFKVCQYPAAVADLNGNNLPFKFYHVSSSGDGQIYAPYMGVWICDIVTEISNTLKSIRETGDTTLAPDFSFLERQRADRNRQPEGRGQQAPRPRQEQHGYRRAA